MSIEDDEEDSLGAYLKNKKEDKKIDENEIEMDKKEEEEIYHRYEKIGNLTDIKSIKESELTKNYDVSLEFFNENGAFLEKYAFDNLKEYHLEKFTDLLHATCTPIENLKEYIVKLGASVDKINIFCKNTDEKDKIINICKDNLNAKVTFSLEYNAEINSPTASKGNALKNLCKQLNIKSSEVIAFGDSSNDISMLKFAKYSFAMGNAIDEVKQIAFMTVPTNDEDGIAVGLKNLNLALFWNNVFYSTLLFIKKHDTMKFNGKLAPKFFLGEKKYGGNHAKKVYFA